MSAGGPRCWILLLAALAFFAEGLGTAAMGLALPALLADWHLPRRACNPDGSWACGLCPGCDRRWFRRRPLRPRTCALRHVRAHGCRHRGLRARAGRVPARRVARPCRPGAWRLASHRRDRHRGFQSRRAAAAGAVDDRAGFSADRRVCGRGGDLAHRAAFRLARTLSHLWIGGSGAPDNSRLRTQFWHRRRRPQPGVGPAGSARASRGAFTLHLGAGTRDTVGLWAAFFCTVLLYYSMFSWAPAAFTAHGLRGAAVSRLVSVFSIGGLIGGVASGALVQWLGSRVCWVLLGAGAIACSLALPHAVPSNARTSSLTPLAATIALLGVTVVGCPGACSTRSAQRSPGRAPCDRSADSPSARVESAPS